MFQTYLWLCFFFFFLHPSSLCWIATLPYLGLVRAGYWFNPVEGTVCLEVFGVTSIFDPTFFSCRSEHSYSKALNLGLDNQADLNGG